MDSSSKGIDEFVREVVEVILGLKRTFYLADLSTKYYFQSKEEGFDVGTIQYNSDNPVLAVNEVWTVRDLIQKCFALLGVEIEFCGKGENEKGVIIDTDVTLLDELKFDLDTIKFGQTVVKVEANRVASYLDNTKTSELTRLQVCFPDFSIDSWLKNLLLEDLDNMRKVND